MKQTPSKFAHSITIICCLSKRSTRSSRCTPSHSSASLIFTWGTSKWDCNELRETTLMPPFLSSRKKKQIYLHISPLEKPKLRRHLALLLPIPVNISLSILDYGSSYIFRHHRPNFLGFPITFAPFILFFYYLSSFSQNVRADPLISPTLNFKLRSDTKVYPFYACESTSDAPNLSSATTNDSYCSLT